MPTPMPLREPDADFGDASIAGGSGTDGGAVSFGFDRFPGIAHQTLSSRSSVVPVSSWTRDLTRSSSLPMSAAVVPGWATA